MIKFFCIIIFIIIILFIFIFINRPKLNYISQDDRKKKLAIVFFGLMRSLPFTINNIKENIFNVLDKNEIEYDIFAHTYTLNKFINNPRSNEFNSEVKNDNYKLLNYKNMIIEDEDTFDNSINYENYKKNGDPWNNNWISLKNVIRSLSSLKNAISLVDDKYDNVLVLRPDMIYNKFNIYDLSKIKKNRILLPFYHPSGGYNDRIALGSLTDIRTYANRYDNFLNYSIHNTPHAETFLKHIIDSNNIKIKEISLKGKRVRTNGSIADWDRYLF